MLRLREKQTRQIGSEKCQPRDRDKKTWAVKRQNVGFCLPVVDNCLFSFTRPEPCGHDIADFQAWPRTSPNAASLERKPAYDPPRLHSNIFLVSAFLRIYLGSSHAIDFDLPERLHTEDWSAYTLCFLLLGHRLLTLLHLPRPQVDLHRVAARIYLQPVKLPS